jgi:hypothetical protein
MRLGFPRKGDPLAWFLLHSRRRMTPDNCRSHRCRARCDSHKLRNGICCGCRERRSFQRSSLVSRCSSRDPSSHRLWHGQPRGRRMRSRRLTCLFWSRKLSRRSKHPHWKRCPKGLDCTDGLIAVCHVPLSNLVGGGHSPLHQTGRWPAGSDVCWPAAAATRSGHFLRSSRPRAAAHGDIQIRWGSGVLRPPSHQSCGPGSQTRQR